MFIQKILKGFLSLLLRFRTVYALQISKNLFPVFIPEIAADRTAEVNPALLVVCIREQAFYSVPHPFETIGSKQKNLLYATGFYALEHLLVVCC